MTIKIFPTFHLLAAQARARQATLTKPAGALGRLENISIRIAGMTGCLDWLPNRKTVIVCAADHGIVAQGVSLYPQEVTHQMVLNFLSGGAAINVLAKQMGVKVVVVDAGVKGELPKDDKLFIGKIAHGTQDFSQMPAMTDDQAKKSIELGMQVAEREILRGVDVVAIGEMGIGNTTSASAIISAITGKPVREVTGRGTGISDESFEHKVSIIEKALALHAPANVGTLAKVGGFEIGTMAGIIMRCAMARIPVVLDGLISTSAALIAHQYVPDVKNYLIAGHRSVEIGHQIALDYLELEPLLDLGLRLGEGTGAVLALPMIEVAMRTFQEMATFSEADVSDKNAE
jgi:nicotinate-nucleotide--dimethylbenzimidazole phosphoribosyltransferase